MKSIGYQSITRRRVIGSAMAGAAILALPRFPEAANKHPLLEKFISVDTHTHPGTLYRRRGNANQALRNIKNSQLTAVVFSVMADAPVLGRRGIIKRKPGAGEFYNWTFKQLKKVRHLVEDAGMPIITSPEELMAAKTKGTPGVILAIEGGDFAKGRMEAIEKAYKMGVRVIQPGHYYPGGLTDIQKKKSKPKHGGLSAKGKKFVQELNRLGIIVDAAHMTPAAAQQTVEISSTPVIVSHTLYINKITGGRFIDADHVKLIAKSGGFIGVWSLGHRKGTPSKETFIKAFRTFADIGGVDHVGLGTDLNSTSGWFNDYGDLPELVAGLSGAGFSEDEIGKVLGGNFLRVFKKVVEGRKG